MGEGTRHVVVVGGGFAGLACAVRLARSGVRVTLLERRPFLGGRAYSFRDPATGDVVDNGPHLLAGAYTETLDFLREIGALAGLAFQRRLDVRLAHRRLGWGAVAAPPVPGPLQAPAALLHYRLLPLRDRLRVAAGAVRLATRSPAALRGTTVAAALDAAGQSPAACQRFWHPLVIATLNEEPALAAAAPFAAVLRRLFLAGAGAARFALARGPLGDLYTGDARRAIEAAGGTVATGATVTGLALRDGRATGVVLRDGRRVRADAVVLALPCAALLRLLPPALAAAPPFRPLAAVGTSPIVSVHLWLDRPVGWGAPFVGLLDARAQWLFDHGTRVASVTSGARFWDDAADEDIAAEVLADARAVLPALGAATVRRTLVIRERHATFSLTPAADAVRPSAETPVSNLFLAGDWTATGLPATIEGAVLSGRRAAALAAAVRPEPTVAARAAAAAPPSVGV